MKSYNICKFPVSALDTGALSIGCFVKETDPSTMKRAYTLTQNRLLLLTEGSGIFRINGSPVSLCQGTLLFCFKDEAVALERGESPVYMYIDFDGIRADDLLRRFDITPLSRVYDGQDGLIPLWQESLFRASEQMLGLVAESILLYSFSRLYREQSTENGLLGQIIRLTEQGFGDPDLSISRIAEELSYHPKYLSHLFKEKAGITYSEYLRSVRLKYATSLFDHGIDSVKNVALLSGFSDPLYFSNVFKKSLGLSPKEYLEKTARNTPALSP